MGIFDENRKICEGAGSHLETKILEAAQATRYPPEAVEEEKLKMITEVRFLMLNEKMITSAILGKGKDGNSSCVAPETKGDCYFGDLHFVCDDDDFSEFMRMKMRMHRKDLSRR